MATSGRGGAGRQRSRCPLAALCLPLEDASHAGVPSPGSERSNRGSALARLSAAGDVLPGGARRAPAPRCTAYLTGNHIIAERMYRRDLAAMPHAQPGTVIYADSGGPAEGSSPAGRAPPLQLDRPGERRRARPWPGPNGPQARWPARSAPRPGEPTARAGGAAGRAKTHRVRGLRCIRQIARMRWGAFEA